VRSQSRRFEQSHSKDDEDDTLRDSQIDGQDLEDEFDVLGDTLVDDGSVQATSTPGCSRKRSASSLHCDEAAFADTQVLEDVLPPMKRSAVLPTVPECDEFAYADTQVVEELSLSDACREREKASSEPRAEAERQSSQAEESQATMPSKDSQESQVSKVSWGEAVSEAAVEAASQEGVEAAVSTPELQCTEADSAADPHHSQAQTTEDVEVIACESVPGGT